MNLIKCSKEAWERCPTREYCGPAGAAEFNEGSECHKFNVRVAEKASKASPKVDEVKKYKRAVKIAARVMTAAGLCQFEDRGQCPEHGWGTEVCDKCIEKWLMSMARREIKNEGGKDTGGNGNV